MSDKNTDKDNFQLIVNENWCNIDKEDKEKDEKYEMDNRLKLLEERFKKMEEKFQEIQTEHLKTMNKLLETEISLERTKNLLVRNHIPFPFSSSSYSAYSMCKDLLSKKL